MDFKYLLIFSISFLGGLIPLIIGFNYRNNLAYKTKNWQTVQGQVLEIKRFWNSIHRFTPIVTYRTPQGQQVTFNGHGGSLAFYEINETVDIIYNPDNIQKAYIKDDKGRLSISRVYLTVGAMLLFCCLYGLISAVIQLLFNNGCYSNCF